MLIDVRRAIPGSVFETDVCVIGSGPAGATVAAELVDRGIGVIVLEGGADGADRVAADTYRGTPGTGAHDPLDAVRQKRLGGSSGVWGGRCAPLDDMDLRPRDWVPDSGWPIACTSSPAPCSRRRARSGRPWHWSRWPAAPPTH